MFSTLFYYRENQISGGRVIKISAVSLVGKFYEMLLKINNRIMRLYIQAVSGKSRFEQGAYVFY